MGCVSSSTAGSSKDPRAAPDRSHALKAFRTNPLVKTVLNGFYSTRPTVSSCIKAALLRIPFAVLLFTGHRSRKCSVTSFMSDIVIAHTEFKHLLTNSSSSTCTTHVPANESIMFAWNPQRSPLRKQSLSAQPHLFKRINIPDLLFHAHKTLMCASLQMPFQ